MPVLSLAASAGPGERGGASSGAVEEGGGGGGKSHTRMRDPLLYFLSCILFFLLAERKQKTFL